jgi:cytoplasmic iron level regulating protein YaaA (DUF328/UPF0246 family)
VTRLFVDARGHYRHRIIIVITSDATITSSYLSVAIINLSSSSYASSLRRNKRIVVVIANKFMQQSHRRRIAIVIYATITYFMNETIINSDPSSL